MTFPWLFPQKPRPTAPREIMLDRLSQGVPPELAARAAGVELESLKNDPEAVVAMAEGEIMLFEHARDSGVTGIVRAAQRYETRTWVPKADAIPGASIEDYLKD